MGFLRSLFGPSKKEIWSQLSEQVGGNYVDGGFWKGDKLEVHVGPWVLTLDTYTVSTGNSSVTYTRMRAPYVNADGFRFEVYRAGFFSTVGKWFGMQDVEIGEPFFDEQYIIKGNCEARLCAFFGNPRVRQLIREQPHCHLVVRDDEGWFGTDFPDGVDELCFTRVGVMKDLDQLRGLFELFAESLHQLCHMGSAYEDDPQVAL